MRHEGRGHCNRENAGRHHGKPGRPAVVRGWLDCRGNDSTHVAERNDDGPRVPPDRCAMMRTTVGIRLKPEHVREAISYAGRDLWFEVDAEDHMTTGDRDLALLEEIRRGGR